MRSRLLLPVLLSISSCTNQSPSHDASGVFEAIETTISAEVSGQIQKMPVEEGQRLEVGVITAEIDCSQLELQKALLVASDRAIGQKTTEAKPQLDILREQQKATEAQLAVQREQRNVLERDRQRAERLVTASAAPSKMLTDVEGQIAVLDRQMASTTSQIEVIRQQQASYAAQVAIQNRATTSERSPAQARIAQLDQQIEKCQVKNPKRGTVLAKYAEQFEFATPGKPLYKIADLDRIVLRAYITGDQLPTVKLKQAVRIFVDAGPKRFREIPGTLVWISDKAEFTPKTIQTKDERSNLVYAVKIHAPNDGSLKIGMYGEVSF